MRLIEEEANYVIEGTSIVGAGKGEHVLEISPEKRNAATAQEGCGIQKSPLRP
jgi:hypothetical protein